jgi:enoyl-CoA hydratase/carnithine racemase
VRNFSTLACDLHDRVLTITLNRPERRNAFTVQMADDLVEAFTEANLDDGIGAVIVTGAGKSFCAGMDLAVGGNVFGLDESLRPTLKELRERLHEPSIERGVRDTGGRVVLAIFQCTKPVVAAINGDAVGVGATMTLPMDFRLATAGARIGFVFARIGIVPESCSSWFLPRLVGMQKALEWCYSAELISAADAQTAGLLRSVVTAENLLVEAQALARRIIGNHSAVAIAVTRQMLWRNAALLSPLEAHLVESLAVLELSQGDGREGVQAFLEKRTPQFVSKVSSDMPRTYPWWDRE